LQWLQHPPERHQTLVAEVERLRYDLSRVTEELDKADLSREHALEEVELFQARLAEATTHLQEARTAYSVIVSANRLMDAELRTLKESRKTVADLQAISDERLHIIGELQTQIIRLGGRAEVRSLEEDTKRIKAALDRRNNAQAFDLPARFAFSEEPTNPPKEALKAPLVVEFRAPPPAAGAGDGARPVSQWGFESSPTTKPSVNEF